MRDHVNTERGDLQTTCRNFTEEMNCLDFEVKGQGHDETKYSKNHLFINALFQ